MKRSQLWRVLAILGVVGCAQIAAAASEDHILGGVEIGGVGVLAPLERYSSTGATLSPFAAYMYKNVIGAMGQLHIVGLPNKDRVGELDDDATWIFGATAGPRLDIPFGDIRVYGTWQGGIFTGLAPHSSVTDTSWGFSTGGGVSFPVTQAVRFGGFCKYNRLYQRVHGRGDVRYVTAGLNLTYDFTSPPPPPPKAPETAQAPPPAPAPPVKKKIVLRGVNFDVDKSQIRADARPVLDEAVNTLKTESTIKIVAEGHTDSTASDAYNQKLSERRAVAVKEYLVKGGIATDRIQTEGFGESRPVATNDTADGRAQNRRVELRVVGD